MKISLTPRYENVQRLWQVDVVLYQQRLEFEPRLIHMGLVEKVSLGDVSFSIPPRSVIPPTVNSYSSICQRRHKAVPIARDVK